MLRTNLATRPFYNERAVYMVLGVVALLGLAVLASLVLRIVELSGRNTELTRQAEQADLERADLSVRTAEVQRAVSPQALDGLAAAAREANTLIDQRVFSWTQFFNRVETTLPPDVMLTEVRPDISPESVEVSMLVVGRALEGITGFIDALEESGAFADVLNRSSELTDEGMYQAVVRGRYLQEVVTGTGGDDPDPVLTTTPDGDPSAEAAVNAGPAEDAPANQDEPGAAVRDDDPAPDASAGTGDRQAPPGGGAL